MEINYKDFIGEILPNNIAGKKLTKLPYKDWQPLIPMVKYEGFKRDVLKFFVANKWNGWNTYIQFPEFYAQVNDTSLNANEAARLLFWGGNIKFHCNCPAYSFWGMQYICTELDAAIVPETRFPKTRNPELKGIVCKHGIKTLKVLPFHLSDIASAIKSHRAGKTSSPEPEENDL